jgi:hypothetical protein
MRDSWFGPRPATGWRKCGIAEESKCEHSSRESDGWRIFFQGVRCAYSICWKAIPCGRVIEHGSGSRLLASVPAKSCPRESTHTTRRFEVGTGARVASAQLRAARERCAWRNRARAKCVGDDASGKW